MPPQWLDPEQLRPGGSYLFADDADKAPVWGHGDEILWHSGEGCLLVGPTGAGKTTLTNQLVLALVGLRPEFVLGYRVNDTPRKVLYLAGDRPDQWRRAMRRNVTEDDVEVLDKLLTVWRGPSPQDIARHPDTLRDMAHAADADIVFVDSLKDAALRLSDDDTGGGIHRAVNLALVAGIEVFVNHHQRKGQDGRKPNTIEDVYGSTWIVNGMGSVILLWGDPGAAVVEMSHLKQPAGLVGPFTLEHDHFAGTTHVLRGNIDYLAMLTAGGTTIHEIAMVLYGGNPSEAQTKKVNRRLEQLVKEGKARKMGVVRGGEGGSSPARYFPFSIGQNHRTSPLSDLGDGQQTASDEPQ